MPDTKSGIRHLSSTASMHHSIYVFGQKMLTQQFQQSMKQYTNEINRIKEDMRKLEEDKLKYSNQECEEFGDLKELSHPETINNLKRSLGETRTLKLMKQQSYRVNGFLTKKVKDFGQQIKIMQLVNSNSSSSSGNKADEQVQTIIPEGSTSSSEGKYGHKEPNALSAVLTNAISQGFQNDRYVTSVISDARAKLQHLYHKSVLGIPPNRYYVGVDAEETPRKGRYNHRDRGQGRSWSATGPATRQQLHLPGHARKVASAVPVLSAVNYDYSSNKEVDKRATEQSKRKIRGNARRPNVMRLDEGFNNEYHKFQQAYLRTMRIREIKAAEYDANHEMKMRSSVTDYLPVDPKTMSLVFKKQSAYIALERSYL